MCEKQIVSLWAIICAPDPQCVRPAALEARRALGAGFLATVLSGEVVPLLLWQVANAMVAAYAPAQAPYIVLASAGQMRFSLLINRVRSLSGSVMRCGGGLPDWACLFPASLSQFSLRIVHSQLCCGSCPKPGCSLWRAALLKHCRSDVA